MCVRSSTSPRPPAAPICFCPVWIFRAAWPKLEVVRAGNSAAPVANPSTLLALVTDLPLEVPGVPTLPLGDAEGAAALLIRYVKEGKARE